MKIPNLSRKEVENLPNSLKWLIETIEKENEMDPVKITKLVKEAKITPDDLTQWVDFDHSVMDSYGRKLIYFNGKFEMLAMSWMPGDFSTIHDHGRAQWGTVQVFGPAEHAILKNGNGKISTLRRWELEPNETIMVTHELLHLMGNNTNKPYLTFHLYGNLNLEPNLRAVTVDARLFNLDKNRIEITDNGVFFLLPKEKIYRIESCPKPDFPTWLRHEAELLKRLYKIYEVQISLENKDVNVLSENTTVSAGSNNKSNDIPFSAKEIRSMIEETYNKICDLSNWQKLSRSLVEVTEFKRNNDLGAKADSELMPDISELDKDENTASFFSSFKEGFIEEPKRFDVLFRELREAAKICKIYNTELNKGKINTKSYSKHDSNLDSFRFYASIYDEVVGKPNLTLFVANYIKKLLINKIIINEFGKNLETKKEPFILSIGSGTGLTESFLLKESGLLKENLIGIDLSEAMVEVSKERINATCINAVNLNEQTYKEIIGKKNIKPNIIYSGLDALQYLKADYFEKVIKNIYSILDENGYFIGDFITPDHISKYPNVILTDKALSLRIPKIIEENGFKYQQSELINVFIKEESSMGNMKAIKKTINYSYEGKHKRYLPNISEVVNLFSKYFKKEPEIYDAFTLEPISIQNSAPSTRYVLLINKS